MKPSRSLQRVRTVVIGCLAVIVGLALGELGLRVAGIRYPVFDAYDHDRATALKSGKEGWYEGEGKAYIKINGLGYRDIERSKAKPPHVFRIAVLGDSFTEARQVDIEHTFWKRLETHLAEFRGRRVEILNFGIGGYGTAQQLLTLKLHVLGFSPDLVLLAFSPGNDLSDNSMDLSTRAGRTFKPFYQLRDGQLVLDNSFRNMSPTYLLRRLQLSAIHYSRILEVVNQARRVIAVRRMRQQPGAPYEVGLFDEEFLEPTEDVWKEAWQITSLIIAKMKSEVIHAGARFAVVTLTAPIQVDPDVRKREEFQRMLGVRDLFYSERRLAKLGDEVGFPVIILAERMQRAATEQRVHFHGFVNSGFGTGHWNETGHEIAAAIIARDLATILDQYR
jgi:hypothetical protein